MPAAKARPPARWARPRGWRHSSIVTPSRLAQVSDPRHQLPPQPGIAQGLEQIIAGAGLDAGHAVQAQRQLRLPVVPPLQPHRQQRFVRSRGLRMQVLQAVLPDLDQSPYHLQLARIGLGTSGQPLGSRRVIPESQAGP